MKDDSREVLFIILFVLAFRNFGPSNDKANIYLANCAPHTGDAIPCQVKTLGNKVEVRAKPETQVVVWLEQGVASKLNSCTVFDEKNWYCGNVWSHQVMRDGEYEPDYLGKDSVQQVGWWRWQLLRAEDLLTKK